MTMLIEQGRIIIQDDQSEQNMKCENQKKHA